MILNGAAGATTTAATYNSAGTRQATNLAFTAITGTQSITFQSTDASGKLVTDRVDLGATANAAAAVSAINTSLQQHQGTGLAKIVASRECGRYGRFYFHNRLQYLRQHFHRNGRRRVRRGCAHGKLGRRRNHVRGRIGTSGALLPQSLPWRRAVKALGAAQAIVGKSENVMNYATSLASTQLTNLASSESQIRDADLAAQAANLSKAQILSQAGVAALAQANSAPQAVLSLLKG